MIITNIHQVVKLDMLLCVLMSISVLVEAQLRLGRPRSHRRQVKQWQMKPRQLKGTAKTVYVVSVIDRISDALICKAW